MLNDNQKRTETVDGASRQNLNPPKERDIFKMKDTDEIEQLFAWYNFTDELGHNLVNCLAFKHLVARAVNR